MKPYWMNWNTGWRTLNENIEKLKRDDGIAITCIDYELDLVEHFDNYNSMLEIYPSIEITDIEPTENGVTVYA